MHSKKDLTLNNVKRIGILAHGFANWGGGIEFIRLLSTSIKAADPEVELHILAPKKGPLIYLRNIRDWIRLKIGKADIVNSRPDFRHIEHAFAGIDATLHPIDLGRRSIALATRRLKLNAVLPAIVPQFSKCSPWVGYLCDFQHKYLPHYFSKEEVSLRDKAFERMLDEAAVVIVNAKSVAKDIDCFYPNHKARVFVLPFSPAPPVDAFSVCPKEAMLRYGISGPYFIICNQFWQHKDHGTAFKAFATLTMDHPAMSLVCTGIMYDYRDPNYFQSLITQIQEAGIANRIHFLGLIPKPDQLALINGSVALVQPTLFEGGPGGGAVYDAVALGKQSIVSDIPVNTEITDPTVSFFRASDSTSLACAMEQALSGSKLHKEAIDQDLLIQRGIERRVASGKVLLTALESLYK